MIASAALLIAMALQSPPMAALTPAADEPRPAAQDASPWQRTIDAAVPGDVIDVPAGEYHGDLVIDRRIRLVGHGRPVFIGAGHGSVIRVRAAGVEIDGIDVDGRGGGDVSRDSSGIHVWAPHATIRDCRIHGALFGVYLRDADHSVVERCTIDGRPDLPSGEQGSGIHVFRTDGFRLAGNVIRHMRDGIYIQASPHGTTAGNITSDLRYGLHYMFSDDNVFEDNTFETSAAGAALMYSRRLTFRRNRFLRNRGFASVGLLMQGCDDVVAEDNLIANNARGVFLEGARRNTFRGNVIVDSDVALVIYDSVRELRVTGNTFAGNLAPAQFVGRRTDTIFDRNYWSDSTATDFDGDGVQDAPYRVSNAFDHLRGNLVAADLFAQGLGAAILARAEQEFPVLDPSPLVDLHPLARPPHNATVPGPGDRRAGRNAWLAGISLASAACGVRLFAAASKARA
jgi:nitrous oxidase accessory protein